MSVDSLRRQFEDLGLGLEASTLAPLQQDEAILTMRVAGGQEAVDAWQRLRRAVDRTGRWPILCGDVAEPPFPDSFAITTDSVGQLLADVPDGRPLDALTAAEQAERQRMADWFASRGEPLPPFMTMELEDEVVEEDGDDAEWPDQPPRKSFALSSAFDVVTQQPFEQCLIALLPTTQPADAPAYLRFGGWNACPAPPIHVAFFRDWEKRFGAVPAAITRDVIECHVASPPQTPDEARALAREQFKYCGDIVSQGTQSVERLAIELWNSPSWYFWWD